MFPCAPRTPVATCHANTGSYVERFDNTHACYYNMFVDCDIKRGVTEDILYEATERSMKTVAECTDESIDLSNVQVLIVTTVDREGNFAPYTERYRQCPFCQGEVAYAPTGNSQVCGSCTTVWGEDALTGTCYIDRYGPDVEPIDGERHPVPTVQRTLKSGFHIRFHGLAVTYQLAVQLTLLMRQNMIGIGDFTVKQIEEMVDFAPHRGRAPSLRYLYARKGAQCPTCFGQKTMVMDGRSVQCVRCFGSGRVALDKSYSILDVCYFTNGKWLTQMVEEEATGEEQSCMSLPRFQRANPLNQEGLTAEQRVRAIAEMGGAAPRATHPSVPPFQRGIQVAGQVTPYGGAGIGGGGGGSRSAGLLSSRIHGGHRGIGAPGGEDREGEDGEGEEEEEGEESTPLHLLPPHMVARLSRSAKIRAASAGARAEYRRRCQPRTHQEYYNNILLASIAILPPYHTRLALHLPADLPADSLVFDRAPTTAAERRRLQTNPHLFKLTNAQQLELNASQRKIPVREDFHQPLMDIVVNACPILAQCKVSRAFFMNNKHDTIVVGVQGRHSCYCYNKAAHNPARHSDASSSSPSSSSSSGGGGGCGGFGSGGIGSQQSLGSQHGSVGEPEVGAGTHTVRRARVERSRISQQFGQLEHVLPGDYHTSRRIYAVITKDGIRFKCHSDHGTCKTWGGTRHMPLEAEDLEFLFGIVDPGSSANVSEISLLQDHAFLQPKFGGNTLRDKQELRKYLRGLQTDAALLNKLAVHNTYTSGVQRTSMKKMLQHFASISGDQKESVVKWGRLRDMTDEEKGQQRRDRYKPKSTRELRGRYDNRFVPPGNSMVRRALTAMGVYRAKKTENRLQYGEDTSACPQHVVRADLLRQLEMDVDECEQTGAPLPLPGLEEEAWHTLTDEEEEGTVGDEEEEEESNITGRNRGRRRQDTEADRSDSCEKRGRQDSGQDSE